MYSRIAHRFSLRTGLTIVLRVALLALPNIPLLVSGAVQKQNEAPTPKGKPRPGRPEGVLPGAPIAFFGAIFLSLLLFIWPNLQSYRQALLVYSALNGNTGRMKLLLALGADVNELECHTALCFTPLVAAAAANQSEAVQMLIANGADVNKKLKRGQTALMIASFHGDTEMVRLLISSGADVNADYEGNTALSWAKQNGHEDTAKLLIEAGAIK